MEGGTATRAVAGGALTVSGAQRDLRRYAVRKLFRVLQARRNRAAAAALWQWRAAAAAATTAAAAARRDASTSAPAVPAPSRSSSIAAMALAAAAAVAAGGAAPPPAAGTSTAGATTPVRKPAAAAVPAPPPAPVAIAVPIKVGRPSLGGQARGRALEKTPPSTMYVPVPPRPTTRTSLGIGPSAVPITASTNLLPLMSMSIMNGGVDNRSQPGMLVAAAAGALPLLQSPFGGRRRAVMTATLRAGTAASLQGRFAAMDTATTAPPRAGATPAAAPVAVPMAVAVGGTPTTQIATPIRAAAAAGASGATAGGAATATAVPILHHIRQHLAAAAAPPQSVAPPPAAATPPPPPAAATGNPRAALMAALAAPGTKRSSETATGATLPPPGLTAYSKMLAAGVPADAIRARMRADGVAGSPSNLRAGAAAIVPPAAAAVLSPRLAGFAKMMTLGVPPLAVRHKMMADGCSEADVAAVLNGGAAPAPKAAAPTAPPAAAAVLSPRLVRFAKMMTMGVPPPAVRHKMVADGCSEADVTAVLNGGAAPAAAAAAAVPAPAAPAPAAAAAAPLSPRLARYAKMISMGVPGPAVAARMSADGCTAADVGTVTGSGPAPAPRVAAPKPVAAVPAPAASTVTASSSSSTATGAAAAVAPPPAAPPAVSVAASAVAAVASGAVATPPATPPPVRSPQPHLRGSRALSSPPTAGVPPQPTTTTTTTTSGRGSSLPRGAARRLHWRELDSAAVAGAAFWAGGGEPVAAPASLAREVAAAFAQPAPTGGAGRPRDGASVGAAARTARDSSAPPGSRGDGAGAQRASVIDGRRAGNIAIVLSRFSAWRWDDVAAALDSLRSPPGGPGAGEDALRALVALVPTATERDTLAAFVKERSGGKALAALGGEEARGLAALLVPPDAWLLRVATAPRWVSRSRCLLVSMELSAARAGVLQRADTVARACSQLRTSRTLHALLHAALAVGNALNAGAPPAAGFALDSLPKLAQLKTGDRKRTALAYVVRAVREGSGAGEDPATTSVAAALQAECNAVATAVTISLEGVEADANAMRGSARVVAAEVAWQAAAAAGGVPPLPAAGAFVALARDAAAAADDMEAAVRAAKAEFGAAMTFYGTDAAAFATPDTLAKAMVAFFSEVAVAEAELTAKPPPAAACAAPPTAPSTPAPSSKIAATPRVALTPSCAGNTAAGAPPPPPSACRVATSMMPPRPASLSRGPPPRHVPTAAPPAS